MEETDSTLAFGGLLKRLRQEAGLSLYELGQRSGVNRAKLLRMECGEIRQPTMATISKVAAALRVEPEDFYDAMWQDSDGPLPSPAVYLRSKYHLSGEQVAKLAEQIERLAADDDSP